MKYPYPNDTYTNTADALCKLKSGFSEGNGARTSSGSVFRFVVILTDGKSNLKSSDCNNWTTIQAADAIHHLDPPVLEKRRGLLKLLCYLRPHNVPGPTPFVREGGNGCICPWAASKDCSAASGLVSERETKELF